MDRFGFDLIPALAGLALLATGSSAAAEAIAADRVALIIPDAKAIVAQCRATQCTRLNLDGAFLDDFTVLNDMTHVTSLMVSYTNFDDLTDVAGMTQLTELHIGQTEVAYLEGLAAFPNLEVVHAQGLRNVTDFSPLFAQTGLRELGIDAPDDLSVLAQMDRLQALYVMEGQIDDLGPLATMEALEVLHIEAGMPEDVSPLMAMPALREVTFNWFAVEFVMRAALESSGVTVRDVPIEIEVLC